VPVAGTGAISILSNTVHKKPSSNHGNNTQPKLIASKHNVTTTKPLPRKPIIDFDTDCDNDTETEYEHYMEMLLLTHSEEEDCDESKANRSSVHPKRIIVKSIKEQYSNFNVIMEDCTEEEIAPANIYRNKSRRTTITIPHNTCQTTSTRPFVNKTNLVVHPVSVSRAKNKTGPVSVPPVTTITTTTTTTVCECNSQPASSSSKPVSKSSPISTSQNKYQQRNNK
jgi:hypothetical protein